MNDTLDNPVLKKNQVADDAPLTLANEYVDRTGKHEDGELSLRFWRGEWYRWNGHVYQLEVGEQLNSRLWTFLASLRTKTKKAMWVPYRPDATRVRHAAEALKSVCQAFVDEMPGWLDTNRPNPSDIIAFRNGLLNVSECVGGTTPMLRPPSPLWFSRTCLPYNFSASAGCQRWTSFLTDVFDGDAERVSLLQEWFGYCLTTDTSQQKLLLLVGPPRSGKGTITRTMERVIGHQNVANPTLSDLGERFGLATLVGKSAALCGDAHLGRGSETTRILETLKTIVGEDRRDVDRKNREALAAVRIYARFTIAVNELPRLDDASAALVPRLLVLPMFNSYIGREDRALDAKLVGETPGIMRWALDGLHRLRKSGEFTIPQSSKDELHEFERLSSPLKAFVEDCCEMVQAARTDVSLVYAAYKQWALMNGHKPMAVTTFGAKLHAAVPGLRRTRLRAEERRQYYYDGIELKPGWVLTPSVPDGI